MGSPCTNEIKVKKYFIRLNEQVAIELAKGQYEYKIKTNDEMRN